MTGTNSRFREIASSSLKVGASTLASLIGWIVAGKILALELGAAGVGIFGLLRQLLQNLSTLSTLNGSNALVQGIASRSGAEQVRYSLTVGRIYLLGGLSVAIVLLGGAPWLGPWLVPHRDAVPLLRWLGLAVLAVTAQGFFIGLLSAHRSVNALVVAQLLGSVSVLILALPMARLVRSGEPLGLVMMLAGPALVSAAAAWTAARRGGWFRPRGGPPAASADARSFLRVSAVMFASGAVVTGAQYVQSRIVADRLGLEQAGLFWVAWTLSMTYVTVLLGSYATYYMPALTRLTDPDARRALIREYLRLTLLVMPVLVSAVVLLKPWIVHLMFSAALMPSLDVMRWMLVGDFLKGISWVLAFPMLAFAELRRFLWSEIGFNLAQAVVAWGWLLRGGGIEGLGAIFLLTYVSYLGFVLFYIRTVHRYRVSRREAWQFLAGLAVVVVVSALTWRHREVRLAPALTLVALVLCFMIVFEGRSAMRWTRRARAAGEGPECES